MRVELKSEGGVANFPGLNRPVAIDTAGLAPEEADRLTQLITAAGFFDLPPVVGPPRAGEADFRKHTITVTDPPRHHTVAVFDPIANRAFADLVDYLKRGRTAGR
jgi:hypothetical protein